ncbi:YegP family protein [Chitinophaga sp. S165]|uniref:YegP family protein n=1 Tax=Chitinophaga sp. S165 TaxID=2135462 RepID=UPI000D70C9CC|nr:YegP family protein [Chitinophaga sp. S165]PWV56343.1 hypothetical protein C7475_101858 [Chitinophaga sp. S165]
MGKLVIIPSQNKEYRFKLVDDNGQTVIVSESYATKIAASRASNSFRSDAVVDDQFVKLTSSDGKPYFILISGCVTLATSQMYESEAERDNAIAAVKRYAPDAILDDGDLRVTGFLQYLTR